MVSRGLRIRIEPTSSRLLEVSLRRRGPAQRSWSESAPRGRRRACPDPKLPELRVRRRRERPADPEVVPAWVERDPAFGDQAGSDVKLEERRPGLAVRGRLDVEARRLRGGLESGPDLGAQRQRRATNGIIV